LAVTRLPLPVRLSRAYIVNCCMCLEIYEYELSLLFVLIPINIAGIPKTKKAIVLAHTTAATHTTTHDVLYSRYYVR
jgi:hypothetical protein